LAKLFVESGWSQEQLAAHLSLRWQKEVSREWVAKHSLFGRFLKFFGTTGTEEWSSPVQLTERGFRSYWEGTEAGGNFSGHRANTEAAKQDEQRRFGDILEEMKEVDRTQRGTPGGRCRGLLVGDAVAV
jgi:hypothetical protein